MISPTIKQYLIELLKAEAEKLADGNGNEDNGVEQWIGEVEAKAGKFSAVAEVDITAPYYYDTGEEQLKVYHSYDIYMSIIFYFEDREIMEDDYQYTIK